LLILITTFPSIQSSCFEQVGWGNKRPLIQMIDQCPTINQCEKDCLSERECTAFAFVNAKCALLGADSGSPDRCTSSNPTYWLRTAECDVTSTTTTTSTTTSTSAPSTKSQCPMTTPCGVITCEFSELCGDRCSEPIFTSTTFTSMSCPEPLLLYPTTYNFLGCYPPGRRWQEGPVSEGGAITPYMDLNVFCVAPSNNPTNKCWKIFFFTDSPECIHPTYTDTEAVCPANYSLQVDGKSIEVMNCDVNHWWTDENSAQIPASSNVCCCFV
ncbi:hypothetical protein PENTCL1PPCAC_30654, partial [Pristionchus entomophagus]